MLCACQGGRTLLPPTWGDIGAKTKAPPKDVLMEKVQMA